jgi:glutathione peroxidase
MMRLFLSFALAVGAFSMTVTADDQQRALDFKAKSIDGEPVDLSEYKGKVVLVVNTASQCGLTPQYAGLQQLYAAYKDKGMVVLGFPCNQFGSQEPGSEAEIKQFCSSNYKVTFPMFGKIEVNGNDAAPLYQYLTSKEVEPAGKGRVSWNFEKFLIDREGNLIARYAPRTNPDDPELVKAIESELAKK